MKRALRAVLAWLALAALVVGAPLALLRLGRTAGLTDIDWARLLTTQDTGALLLGVLTVAGWLAWVAFLLTVLAELVSRLSRGKVHLSVPLTGWARPVAAALVMAALGLVAPVAAQTVAAPPAAAAPQTPTPPPSRSTPAPHATPPDTTRAPEQETPQPQDKQQELRTHTVVPGDDLWSVAERHYGDGSRWRAIARENHLDPVAVLSVGTVLRLPGLPVTEEATVTVQPGDTLSGIAADELGDADRWPEIYQENRDTVSDPDLIHPGWVLDLPETHQTERDTGPSHSAPQANRAEPAEPPTAGQPTDPVQPHSTGPATPRPTSPATAAATPEAEHGVPSGGASAAPTAAAGQSRAAATPEPPVDPEVVSAVDTAPDGDRLEEIAGVFGLLALSVLAVLALRRRGQLFRRPLGRRVPHSDPDIQRIEAALARRATEVTEEPEVWPPAAIVVGVRDDQPVVHDLESAGTTVITGTDPEELRGALAAALTGLVSASWSAETSVLLSGDETGWVDVLDQPLLIGVGTVDEGVAELERQASARRIALGRAEGRTVQDLRADPETADAWQPQVHLFTQTPSPSQWRRIRAALRHDSLAPTGVGVCVLTSAELASLPECGEAVLLDGDSARLTGRGVEFTPQVIREPARHALMDLFHTASQESTLPAPWWSSQDDLPANLRLLDPATTRCDEEDLVQEPHFDQPTILVLGPIQLTGARGTEPSRAKGQCLEYAAWIHQNPGRTAAMMNRELLVADSTRRSNLSRLRTWLGASPDGEPYLPDAYTGRIALHPAVGTDWEHLQLLVSQGVDRASTDALVDALRLVRGAPLADAAPGCWHWAEEWRTDMSSTVRDIGVVLAQRALASGNIDLARWAAARALKAAPEDELLMLERVRTEHAAGNHREVERLVLHLNRVSRILGVDLSPETVAALQEVMEGRTRARFA